MTRRSDTLALLVTAGMSLALLSACGGDAVGPEPGAADFADEPAPAVRPELVAFVDVNVVRPESGTVVTGQTVLVRGDRIEAVGPLAEVATEGAFRIEGQGRYLVPGLTDMHTHMTADTFEGLRNDYVLFLANGVTTIRVMWGFPSMVDDRGRIEAGEILGPSLLVASPGLDGPGGPWSGTPAVNNAEEGRARVIDHVATGYDFIKVYNLLSLASYNAIIDEAAIQGIPVVGHVPGSVGIERVQDAGQLTLEHLIGIKLRTSSPFTGGTLNMTRVRELAARSAAAGVWHTPTITVDALSQSEVQQVRASGELGLVSPGMLDFFETGFHNGLVGEVAGRERTSHEAIMRSIRDAGGGLLVGTDAGFGWILPGYSIHDEIAGFVQAGLTPARALRAATSDPALSVGQSDEFGRIEPGLRADLVLVTRNPLEDAGALEESSGVMVRGRWMSRGTLQTMLEGIEAFNAGN